MQAKEKFIYNIGDPTNDVSNTVEDMFEIAELTNFHMMQGDKPTLDTSSSANNRSSRVTYKNG